MAWYRTGTISLTNGSAAVAGSGTAWIANAAPGEALRGPDGRLYEISSVNSDTSMTLATPYLGATVGGQTYEIFPSQSYIRDLAAQAAGLVNSYASFYNTVGQGKFPDGSAGAPAISFSNDTDTGIRRYGSGGVAIVGNGTDQAVFSGGSLSLGVTPSSWAEFKVLEMVGGATFSNPTQIGTVQNGVYDGSSWKYKGAGLAGFTQLAGGVFSVYAAPSGSAGGAISWSQVFGVSQMGQAAIGNENVGGQLVLSGKTGISSQSYLTNTLGDRLSFLYNGTESMSMVNAGGVTMGRTYLVPGSASYLTVAADGFSKFGITVANKSSSNTSFVSFVNDSDSMIAGISQSGSSVIYSTTSDKDNKTDLGICESTDVILRTEIHDFSWKADGKTDRGVFAQDAYLVKPSAVFVGSDEVNEAGQKIRPWGVDYSKYVPDLIVTAQMQERRIEELEAKLAAALARIEALEAA